VWAWVIDECLLILQCLLILPCLFVAFCAREFVAVRLAIIELIIQY
jgi:hypothetical protein